MGISRSENTGDKDKYLKVWERFREYANKRGTKLDLPEPPAWYTTSIEIGDKRDWIQLSIFKSKLVEGSPEVEVNRKRGLAVRIYVRNNRVTLFDFLKERQKEIEEKLGYPATMVWKRYDVKWQGKQHPLQAERSCDWVNPNDEDFEWLLRTGEKFQEVFPKYLKQYYDQGGE